MATQPLIVVDLHNPGSSETVLRTIRVLAETVEKSNSQFLVWNSCVKLPKSYLDELNTKCLVISSDFRFLCSGKQGSQVLLDREMDCVILVDDGVAVNEEIMDCLIEKFWEYDSEVIVCSQGLRVFPHQPFVDPEQFWNEDRCWKYYDANITDREVHLMLMDGGVAVLPVKPLVNGLSRSCKHKCKNIGDFQLSLFCAQKTSTHIWKVQIETELKNIVHSEMLRFSKESLAELNEFYKLMIDENWPLNAFSPLLPKTLTPQREKSTIWTEGFCGLNMSAEPMDLDFQAARAYGASVVRFGAANDAKDLAFLINDIDGGTTETDRAHLKNVLHRLRNAVRKAGESGLKVILSFCDLPLRRFRDTTDDRIWRSSDSRQRIADLWASIADSMAEYHDIIIGYDIINEPFTPDDNDRSFDCDMSNAYISELDDLYRRALKSIRAVDSETMVIVESSFWASPRTVPDLVPLDDPLVVYSFHFYAPSIYTFRHSNDGKYTYPGKIPKWKADIWKDCWPMWNEERIMETVAPIEKWQKDNGIPSSRVFVGEFGVSREVPGAQRYLHDVIKVLSNHGWSWCLFSFRDNEWDAMDYELGTNRKNQLARGTNPLMRLISKHLS